jgi:predicted TPR repeat methyltransferase
MDDAVLEQARHLFMQGLAAMQAGTLIDAEQAFRRALELVPGRLSVLINLGVALLQQGRAEAAIEFLEQAVAVAPDDIDALGHLGVACAQSGRLKRGLEVLQHSLKLNPEQGAAWGCLGSILRELGRYDEAARCFEQALQQGADPELYRYYLAAVSSSGPAASVPRQSPLQYVQGLFDAYSGDFDKHLAVLGYEAPRVLVATAVDLGGFPCEASLDLGCGTGLIAERLRELEGNVSQARSTRVRIDGLDASPGMIQRARQSGAYDELFLAELKQWLLTANRHYQLILAADVFIYVGALEEVFEGVAARLSAGGIFAFSVERLEESADGMSNPRLEGFKLLPSLRYAHSQSYLEALALRNGMSTVRVQEGILRFDQQHPVPGLYVFMRRV